MQIILAVDIIDGKVVKAYAGLRINYKVLKINGVDYSDPIKLIKEIKKKTNISEVYIADLNAIRKLGNNNQLIDIILKFFPKINFIIDSGFDYPLSVFNFHREKKFKKLENYNLILGTETLKNFNLKSYYLHKPHYISIDFNGNEAAWIDKLEKEKIQYNLILMFLRNVGGRGLNLKYIVKLKRKLKKHKISIAGGLKTQEQISQLKRIDIDGVISSSYLHSRVSRDKI